MSFSPTLLQEIRQGASERGTPSELLENARDLMVTKQDSNDRQSCASLEPAVPSQPSDTGPSVWPENTSNAATSSENTAGYAGENGNRGLIDAPSSLEQTVRTEFSHNSVEYGFNMDSGDLHEAHASSQPPDTCSDSLIESNTVFSYNNMEVAVSQRENGVCLTNNVLDGGSEALGLHLSMGATETFRVFEEKFAVLAKQQVLDQESGVAVVVSTDLDGWQRFDAEENEVNGCFGCDQAIDAKSLQKLELWEQLLEEDSESSQTQFQMVEAETGTDSPLHGGNQLASPGNPFIEGLDRLSNFSEADHCTANEFIAKSQLLHSLEADMCLLYQEGLFHTDHSSTSFLQDNLAEKNLGSQLNGLFDHESSQHAKPKFPSFSDIRRSSFNSRDPSSVNFVEQVPTFQVGNHTNGIENGGEKWEANFDLMVPATQGPRSLSLPREAGDTERQKQKQTFSSFYQEAPVMAQSKSLGFSSPKLSPIVKKVINKVWTKPEQVENAICQGKSSSTVDKEPKKRIWRCCMCCSHGN